MRIGTHVLGLLTLLCTGSAAHAWPERGPDGAPTGAEVVASEVFAGGALPQLPVASDPQSLARVAAATLEYLGQRAPDDASVGAGLFGELGIELGRVERTLAFVVKVAEEDAGKATQRLQDPTFLAEHFEVLRWIPDQAGAAARGLTPPSDRIRMTRYLVYQVEGRATPEAPYVHALYGPPAGEPTAWTRQQVMAGVFEPGGEAEGDAAPLVYLTAEGVYQALMQGTVEVALPGVAPRLFNVDVHNGHAYVPTQRDPSKQARYWYFREVQQIRGWADIGLEPRVAVAGDIYNLGLGKLFALRTRTEGGAEQLQLAVLADTGGAFQPNLFQLDYLTGSYPDHTAFQAATGHLPAYVEARMLLLRE